MYKRLAGQVWATLRKSDDTAVLPVDWRASRLVDASARASSRFIRSPAVCRVEPCNLNLKILKNEDSLRTKFSTGTLGTYQYMYMM